MTGASKKLKTEILSEQFIPDHVFVYVAKGTIHCYDGNKNYTFKAGEYFIARKNRLARYKIENSKEEFKQITFCFDVQFLKTFQQKHKSVVVKFKSIDTFLKIKPSTLILSFIRSVKPYQEGFGKLNNEFEDVKLQNY